MKRLSLYLFLILFTFQTPSQADDIRDFQIEGMSVGIVCWIILARNILRVEKNFIIGLPMKKTIIIEVIIDKPVLKVKYLNTFKKEN